MGVEVQGEIMSRRIEGGKLNSGRFEVGGCGAYSAVWKRSLMLTDRAAAVLAAVVDVGARDAKRSCEEVGVADAALGCLEEVVLVVKLSFLDVLFELNQLVLGKSAWRLGGG